MVRLKSNGLLAGVALVACTLGVQMTVAADATRVALVYANSSHDMKCEFDRQFAALGWKVDKYQDKNLTNLTAKLDNYDVVVFGVCAAAVRGGPVEECADSWFKWINFGGALVMTAANDDSSLGEWVAKLGKGLDCTGALCAAYSKPSVETTIVKLGHDPMLDMPRPLGPLYARRGKQWAHLVGLSPEWKTPITCYDDAPLLAYRRVGKGLVLLTTAGDFKGAAKSGRPLDQVPIALFANVKAQLEFAKAELEVKDFIKFERVGASATGCRLVLGTKEDRKLSATFVSENVSVTNEYSKSSVTVTAKHLPSGDWELAPAGTLSVLGEVKRILEVRSGDTVVSRLEWTDDPNPSLAVKPIRRHLFPGDDFIAEMTVNLLTEAAGTVKEVEWRIDDGDWKGGEAAKSGRWNAAVGNLKPGDHVFHARFKYPEGFLARQDEKARNCLDWGLDASAEFVMHPEPKYRVRKTDHALLENGKPFFPFGFYHVTNPSDSLPRQVAAENLAKWGYNSIFARAIWAEGNPKNPRFRNFLDACERDGIRVVTECQCSTKATIKTYGRHPAVMGWLLADEPAAFGFSPESVRDRYESYMKLDDTHLYYMVLCLATQCPKYAPYTDAIAPDIYIPPKGRRLGRVYSIVQSMKPSVEAAGDTLWAVLRGFGGQGYKSPTVGAREFRAESYLAVIAGVKGIIYYTYSDLKYEHAKSPAEYQEAVAAFPTEFNPLIPFWLDGERTVLSDGAADGVYAATWQLGGKTLYVAVNASAEETCVAVCPFKGEIRHVDPSAKVSEADDKTTVELGPLDRVVILR